MGQRQGARRAAPRDALEAAAHEQRRALEAFCHRHLAGRRLWLASNRGPYELQERDGAIEATKGAGGLVTALGAFASVAPVHWVAAAMTRAEAQLTREAGGAIPARWGIPPLHVSYVSPSREQYDGYYDGIANAVLWLLQHQVAHPTTEPTFDAETWQAWRAGYVAVNRQFAAHLGALAAREAAAPVFLVQDYHLYLVPQLLRERQAQAAIAHFTHIDWPGPDAWRPLPAEIRRAILEGLLGADLVGFQGRRHVANFLACCAEFLGAPTDPGRGEVEVAGRRVRVRAFPISIDPVALRLRARSAAVSRAGEAWADAERVRTIAVIARTDPAKNLWRTLRAYDHFLARCPDWQGRVRLVALLPASRQSCGPYRTHLEELLAEGEAIRHRWRRPGWEPIELHLEHDYDRAIALLTQYDVLLVNSLSDGMNLVAKEGPTVNRRAGQLIISEGAGAAEELCHASRIVNPYDVVALAEAMEAALGAHPTERRWALAAQRQAIGAHTIWAWAHAQLAELLPRGGSRGEGRGCGRREA
ncbi:MAG: trehalose-6-phosphate synthase [Candidatus Sericytochromatia bacterium]|nr:trehalose-6-phosphate synthase [Candidatus Sericytochromatia bacterium]